jgi:hypothetical protein
MATDIPIRSLDEQRAEYADRRFTAMPIAGTIAWTASGVAGWLMPPVAAVWTLFIATGSIAYLGMFISRFTGEHFLDRSRPRNAFDTLFLMTVLMALLVYAIAIPFFLIDYTSLPLTVGILTGLMWIPLSWAISHWVGIFHGVTRTVLVLAAWYMFPDARFVVIPAVIVCIYLISIMVLEARYRARRHQPPHAAT